MEKITNEEKAKEIFCKNCVNNGFAKCEESCSCVGYEIGTMDLIQMAKWKDEETEKKLLTICEKHCLPNLHEGGMRCAYLSIEGKHCWDLESEGSEEARK